MSVGVDVQRYLASIKQYVDEQQVKPLSKAVTALKQPYPVWVLAPDATVRAANSLSAWLWGEFYVSSSAVTAIAPASKLLGQNALSVISRNLSRINLAENVDFAVAQLGLIECLTSRYKRIRPQAHELAHGLYSGHRALIRQYEDARPKPAHVFRYGLKIKAPTDLLDATFMLQTTIGWVHDETGQHTGMLVQCRPASDSPETDSNLRMAKKALAAAVAPGTSDFAPADLATRSDAVLAESEPTGVSPLTRAALEESPVRLYLDQSAESRKALAAFKAAGQSFHPLPAAPDSGAPWVEFGDERYVGLAHIQNVISALARFDASFGAGVERLMPSGQASDQLALQRWLEARHRQALAAGQDIVDGRHRVN